jgi:hypothetical protein
MLAANAADISHVAPVSADRQSAFSGNFPLLLGAHGGEPSPALFDSSPGGSGASAAPG